MKYIIIFGIIIGVIWLFIPKEVPKKEVKGQTIIQLGGRTNEPPSGEENIMIN